MSIRVSIRLKQPAALLLKYGDHTKDCATREYHENQHGGFHSFKGLPCNCGWDDLKTGAEEVAATGEWETL